MRAVRWLSVLLAAMVLGACASKAEFDDLKTRVKASGEAVDAWIASAHGVVKWVADNAGTFCPACAPPTPPPSPPPDGDWGS